jgi:hypothetical protein
MKEINQRKQDRTRKGKKTFYNDGYMARGGHGLHSNPFPRKIFDVGKNAKAVSKNSL